jgi:hypothetical protein
VIMREAALAAPPSSARHSRGRRAANAFPAVSVKLSAVVVNNSKQLFFAARLNQLQCAGAGSTEQTHSRAVFRLWLQSDARYTGTANQ